MSVEAGVPRFRPGEPVVVVATGARGHVRTPAYIRGRPGVIKRVCGAFANPEDLAYGRAAARCTLYRVRFLQREVWPGYEGHPEDTLDIELFEHWLTPRAG